MMSDVELKPMPCKMCGAELSKFTFEGGAYTFQHPQNNCFFVRYSGTFWLHPKDVVEWNTRQPDPALLVEALEKLAEKIWDKDPQSAAQSYHGPDFTEISERERNNLRIKALDKMRAEALAKYRGEK